MPDLRCTISEGLWQALQRHQVTTGELLGHIIRAALAEYLQVSHSTLFQVSTSVALVQGVYQGAVRVGTLREHGDHGLGTFENLDGEMVVVDGHFFQMRSDGSVHQVADDVLSPFAVVTRFTPHDMIQMAWCPDLPSMAAATFSSAKDDSSACRSNVKGLSALPCPRPKTFSKPIYVRIPQPIWRKPKLTTEDSGRGDSIYCRTNNASRAPQSSHA